MTFIHDYINNIAQVLCCLKKYSGVNKCWTPMLKLPEKRNKKSSFGYWS